MNLIDRDMACQKMTALYEEDCRMYGVSIPECFDSDRAIEALKELPSIESKQKTGKWINCKYPLGECSECHKIINIQANEAVYCPCCGSKNTSYEYEQ